MSVVFADDWLTVHHGDWLDVLREMPDESVNCVVTSPAYWGLRDYGVAGQLGLEATPEEYVAHLVGGFREVRRVLRRDGTVWLNLGDSYAGSWGAQSRGNHTGDDKTTLNGHEGGLRLHGRQIEAHPHYPSGTGSLKRTPSLKPKDRVMIPARVALALQADGWWLRDEIVWSKPNPMPSSVQDRTTPAHEMVYLLTRSARYWYDAAAIREAAESGPSDLRKMAEGRERIGGMVLASDPMMAASGLTNVGRKRSVGGSPLGKQAAAAAATPSGAASSRTMAGLNDRWDAAESARRNRRPAGWAESDDGSALGRYPVTEDGPTDLPPGRNKRSVWTVATAPYPEAHFATFPPKLIEPMILAGCPVGGVVLDCFAGSGTTGMVAQSLSRRAVLIDLNPDYLLQALRRNTAIPLGIDVPAEATA